MALLSLVWWRCSACSSDSAGTTRGATLLAWARGVDGRLVLSGGGTGRDWPPISSAMACAWWRRAECCWRLAGVIGSAAADAHKARPSPARRSRSPGSAVADGRRCADRGWRGCGWAISIAIISWRSLPAAEHRMWRSARRAIEPKLAALETILERRTEGQPAGGRRIWEANLDRGRFVVELLAAGLFCAGGPTSKWSPKTSGRPRAGRLAGRRRLAGEVRGGRRAGSAGRSVCSGRSAGEPNDDSRLRRCAAFDGRACRAVDGIGRGTLAHEPTCGTAGSVI